MTYISLYRRRNRERPRSLHHHHGATQLRSLHRRRGADPAGASLPGATARGVAG